MNTLANKITGYILLIAGLGIIFWSVYASYGIFNGQKMPPEIFKSAGGEIKPVANPSMLGQVKNQAELQAQMENLVSSQIGEQLKGIMPVDTLPKILNLTSWSIFMGILIFAGGKVAELGIKLLKD